MKKIIFTFVFALVALVATADDFRVVTIQILKSAKYPVSFVDKSLAIYSMQYVAKVDGDDYTFRNDTLLAREAALGVKNALEEWDAFADYDIPVYDFYAFCNGETCNDSIESIKDYNLLIAVRNLTILPYLRMERKYDDDYGNYFHVGAYAPYSVTFEIYDADTRQFLYKETMSDTLLWDKNTTDYEQTIAELPTIREAAVLAATEVGKLYAEKLVPHWVSVQRFFFVLSAKDLMRAADYAEAFEWGEAMKIWEQYAGSTDRKVAAQSAFNMALGCEMNGNYELAIEWLSYAGKIYPIKEIGGYQAILQRRINESNTLEKQLQGL